MLISRSPPLPGTRPGIPCSRPRGFASGQPDHHVRPQRAVGRRHADLLVEVAPAGHPGELDHPAQLHLAPPAPCFRPAQGCHQGLGLGPELVGLCRAIATCWASAACEDRRPLRLRNWLSTRARVSRRGWTSCSTATFRVSRSPAAFTLAALACPWPSSGRSGRCGRGPARKSWNRSASWRSIKSCPASSPAFSVIERLDRRHRALFLRPWPAVDGQPLQAGQPPRGEQVTDDSAESGSQQEPDEQRNRVHVCMLAAAGDSSGVDTPGPDGQFGPAGPGRPRCCAPAGGPADGSPRSRWH